MQIHEGLEDIETKKYLYIPTRILQGITIILSIIILVILCINHYLPILTILSIFLVVLLPIIFKATSFATFGTMWDECDYTGLIKRNITINTKEGHSLIGYIYYPEEFNLNSGETYPTLIGAHGYGSHHKVMDRYTLAPVTKQKYIYFTFDARGHGKNKHIGKIHDYEAYSELKGFIDEVKKQSFVDKKRIAIVGMSLGANKSAVVAYPDPDIKLLILLSGVYDINLNRREASAIAHLQLLLSGFRWSEPPEFYEKFSGYYYFKEEGIVLRGNTDPTPNSKRIFMLANRDDTQVSVNNTLKAIEKLKLPPDNYRIFPKGGHYFKGNEFFLSIEIYEFLKKNL